MSAVEPSRMNGTIDKLFRTHQQPVSDRGYGKRARAAVENAERAISEFEVLAERMSQRQIDAAESMLCSDVQQSEHAMHVLCRQFMAQLPLAAWIRGRDGTVIYVNPAYERHYGITASEMAQSQADDNWDDETAEHYDEHDREVIDSGNPVIAIERIPNAKFDAVEHTLVLKFPLMNDLTGFVEFVGGLALNYVRT